MCVCICVCVKIKPRNTRNVFIIFITNKARHRSGVDALPFVTNVGENWPDN